MRRHPLGVRLDIGEVHETGAVGVVADRPATLEHHRVLD
jgi:hypothetical protein